MNIWRSVLFIPVLQERFLARAAERGADAIVLDLEAGIATGRKEEARKALPAAITRLAAQQQDMLVRVNMLWRAALQDLEVAARPGVKAILLPNCRSAEEIRAIDAVMREIEQESELDPIAMIPIIESAAGVLSACEIASASTRVEFLAFGVEDYLTDMEAAADPDVLNHAAQAIAHGARAAGKLPMVIPESLANIRDMTAFETAARKGRAMGSVGGFAVQPDQVTVLNRVFRPSRDEVDWANRVVRADQEAASAGLGAVTLDDRMIDLPIVLRARRILERHSEFQSQT